MFKVATADLWLMVSAASIFGFTASAAYSATFNVHTSEGRPVRVSNKAAWDEKCNSLSGPVYNFTSKPAHGEVSTRSEDKVIKTCQAGACGCLGRHIAGTAVYYTPEKSFHGADQFSFSS